jgi:putative protein kinase ArgK-like GTPase of G3E family
MSATDAEGSPCGTHIELKNDATHMLRQFISSRLTYVKSKPHNFHINGGGGGGKSTTDRRKTYPLLTMKVVVVVVAVTAATTTTTIIMNNITSFGRFACSVCRVKICSFVLP